MEGVVFLGEAHKMTWVGGGHQSWCAGRRAGVFLLADQFQIVGYVAELDDAEFVAGPDVNDGLAFIVFADLSDDPVPSLVLDDGTFFYGDLHGSFGLVVNYQHQHRPCWCSSPTRSRR